LSYVKSRGLYAGVEVVGQVFVERFDENAAMYHWPGVKAGDIVSFLFLCSWRRKGEF
jgi:lipid-binding SYLF domain-containing protein